MQKYQKQAHAFKGFAGTYNVEILNSFNDNHNLKILNLELKINYKNYCQNWEDLNS